MGHPEDPTRAKDEADAEAERAQHKHPAGGQGSGRGFAKGAPGHRADDAEELPVPDFARGSRQGDKTDRAHRGRFSEGNEQEPEDAPDKAVERRFSEGSEESPTSD
jgi:hypothetical protein